MSAANRILIVGAGLAGVTCARELRKLGYAGSITLLSEEPDLPYDRPPLSKEFAKGEKSAEEILLVSEQEYSDLKIDLRTGIAATAIDVAAQSAELSDGNNLAWDKLLLAQGSQPRLFPGIDSAAKNIHYIRTIDDGRKLKSALSDGKRFVFIGGGVIGMEAAATAIQSGCQVTVLEALPGIMGRFFATEMQEYLSDYHRAQGVDLRLKVRLAEVSAQDSGEICITLEDGSTVEADELVIGIGVIPNTALAESAGIEVDNGILVDEFGESSATDIYAAGDVCRFSHPGYGDVRWENWKHALEQAKCIAANMLGEKTAYNEVPWVWSDQYDLHIQGIGSHEGADQLVWRGEQSEGKFALIYLSQGQVIGATLVNQSRDKKPLIQMVANAMTVSVDQLQDRGTPLKKMLKS